VIERKKRLGCAHSIVSGVTDLVNQYGKIIVLEDDLEVSPEFLNFLLESLDRYRDEPSVAQISASMFAIRNESGTDALFLPFASPYGWATWEHAWRGFDWSVPGWDVAKSDPVVCNRFDHDGSFEHCDILRSTLRGEIDAWDILWEWNIFREKKLVLYPRKSLVRVGGFDGTGTNCGTVLPDHLRMTSQALEQSRLRVPFSWPESVAIDERALEQVKRQLQQERNPDRSLVTRIQRRLQKYGRILRAQMQESI
jgi:hypothetical protein